MEVVSLGEVEVEGDNWKGEAGCQEEEVGMGTRKHWAEVAEEVLAEQCHHKTLF